jgi:hypothetical protein
MTTIITRLYSDRKTAQAVADALMSAGHQGSYIDVIGSADAGAMEHARVNGAAASAYAKAMTGAQTLLVVRAPFSPIGAAKRAQTIVGRYASLDVGLDNEDHYVREQPKGARFLSILSNHPRFLTQDMNAGAGRRRSTVSSAFGMPTLSAYKSRRSAISGGAYISTKFWPMPLISKNKTKHSVISGGGHPFSRLIGMAVISRRD